MQIRAGEEQQKGKEITGDKPLSRKEFMKDYKDKNHVK